jgi:hypothetical protein
MYEQALKVKPDFDVALVNLANVIKDHVSRPFLHILFLIETRDVLPMLLPTTKGHWPYHRTPLMPSVAL